MRLATVLFPVAMLAAMPTVAQVPPGRLGQHDGYVASGDRTGRMAQCIVGRARPATVALVRTPHGQRVTDAQRQALVQAVGGCMSARSASVTVATDDLRGDVAELLLQENGAALLHQAGAMTPVGAQRVANDRDDEDEAIIVCAVAAQPSDAATMIASDAATPAEAASFRAMIPAIQACVPQGYALHLKPYQVRPLVAIALYRKAADGVRT